MLLAWSSHGHAGGRTAFLCCLGPQAERQATHACIHYVFSRMFTLEVFCVTEAAPYLLDARMTTVTAFPRQPLQTRGLMNKQAVADMNHLFRPAHSVSA